MLKKVYRISSSDFQKIQKKGKIKQSPFFIIKYLQNQKDFNRFGISISQKIIPKATQRNALKRKISEVLRYSLNKLRSGFDIIIKVKKGKELNFSEIKKELFILFKEVGILE